MINIKKSWRALPKEERFEIPFKVFNLDKIEIEKIRKIKDIKQRLIESAKLQFETFGDIHSYLTVWIAACGSDSALRSNFGSTQKLLDLFFRPLNFDDQIKPSWQDIKRRITLPQEITLELAEETGIHLGDGNLYVGLKDKWKNYRYGITGDLINEILFHKNHISKLIKKVYNLDPKFIERPDKNSIDTIIKSKSVVEFKNKILKLPIGKKKNAQIPEGMFNNPEFAKKCIAGIIDTDFNITSSLSISGKLHSLFVAKQMHSILKRNSVPHIFKEYEGYGRFYIQKLGALEIVHNWKLNNIKHISKYNLFKEFNKFIPFSTTPERLAVLEGKLDVLDLSKICKNRASVTFKKPSLLPIIKSR